MVVLNRPSFPIMPRAFRAAEGSGGLRLRETSMTGTADSREGASVHGAESGLDSGRGLGFYNLAQRPSGPAAQRPSLRPGRREGVALVRGGFLSSSRTPIW